MKKGLNSRARGILRSSKALIRSLSRYFTVAGKFKYRGSTFRRHLTMSDEALNPISIAVPVNDAALIPHPARVPLKGLPAAAFFASE